MEFGAHIVPEEHVVKKTDHAYVFVNLRPFLPYHLLVSPIRRVTRLKDLSPEESAGLFALLQDAMAALDSLGTAWTVTLQDGKAAGQTVEHVHIHLIPRKDRDLARNNDIYEKINIDIDRPNRSFEEMAEEAKLLRGYFK